VVFGRRAHRKDGFFKRFSSRFFNMFIRRLGFTRTVIDVEHAERAEGGSSYTFRKLLAFALSIVVAYSLASALRPGPK
jgi:hypothetical protein